MLDLQGTCDGLTVCGLVPPEGSFRKKDQAQGRDALLENLGGPADLKRLARTTAA